MHAYMYFETLYLPGTVVGMGLRDVQGSRKQTKSPVVQELTDSLVNV